MVLAPFVGSYPTVLRGVAVPLVASNPRPRAYADVVVVALNDYFVSAAVSLVVPMPMVIVVVVSVIAMPRVR